MTLTDTLRVRVALARHLKAKPASNDERVKELIAAAALLLLGLTRKLAAVQITRRGFTNAAEGALSTHMHQAAALSAGDAYRGQVVDELLLSKRTYLDNFADDIATGAISEAQAAARAQLWSGLAWTAYQMGRGMAAESEARRTGATVSITWDCEDDQNSCDACITLAAGSPYTPDSLPTVPGDDVDCGGNCRCSLSYEYDVLAGSDERDSEDDGEE